VLVLRVREARLWLPAPVTRENLLLTMPPIRTREFLVFTGFAGKRRADERTRTTYPCSLRVIHQALQGFARGWKSRISRGVSFPCLAACCTVLRSRWYQSGINKGMAASRSYSLVHASEVRPALHEGRHHPAYPRPLLTLDALYWLQHRRRGRRGVGLGDLLWLFALPLCCMGAQPQRDVGGLHRLPHHSHQVIAQGI
jgi:hypothetical protein